MMKFSWTNNQRKRERRAVPMPREVDITLPFISDAWSRFQDLDRAQTGEISWDDAAWLVKKITKVATQPRTLRMEVEDIVGRTGSDELAGLSFLHFA